MRSIAAAILACSLAAVMGCGERPAPPPPAPVKPPSAWATADAQAVAKPLAESASREDWVAAFRTRANRAPRVVVGEIEDRSGDHVDVAELASELEKDLAETQQVEVVRTRDQADFVLGGSVGREAMSGGWRYAIDLHLAAKDGDAVWVRSVEREVKAAPPAPAPVPAKAP